MFDLKAVILLELLPLLCAVNRESRWNIVVITALCNKTANLSETRLEPQSLCYLVLGGPLYWNRFALILAWISNYNHHKVCDDISYPFPNFNSHTVEVWLWISNLITHLPGHMVIFVCWDLNKSVLIKWAPGHIFIGLSQGLLPTNGIYPRPSWNWVITGCVSHQQMNSGFKM